MIENLINKIKNIRCFMEYTEFKLEKSYSIHEIKDILKHLKKENVEILYNNISKKFDNIGVIDINNKRYYDFDDNIWTMHNKGLDCSVKF